MRLCVQRWHETESRADDALVCAHWHPSPSAPGTSVVGLLYRSGVFREWRVQEKKSLVYQIRLASLPLPSPESPAEEPQDMSHGPVARARFFVLCCGGGRS